MSAMHWMHGNAYLAGNVPVFLTLFCMHRRAAGAKKISDIDVFCPLVRSAAGFAEVQAARQASITLFPRGIGSICSECLAAILVGTEVPGSI